MKYKSPFNGVLIFLFISLFSCEEKVDFNKENTISVMYEFNDASVPPEYHRSYEIEVNLVASTVNVNVHSYDNVLTNETYPYTLDQSEKLFLKLNNIDPSCRIKEPEPCTGGTSESLMIKTKQKTFEMNLDHCGGNGEYPSGCGEVRTLIDYVKSMVPNLDELLQLF